MKYCISVLFFILLIQIKAQSQKQMMKEPPTKEALKAFRLPPCRACKLLVESFDRGIKRTARNKYDGGDVAWEEEKLGSYKTSEVRLVEIQEHLCRDVETSEDQCHELAESYDAFLEEWWFNHQTTETDLYKWLCIGKAEVCCPELHYGKNCDPCIGYPDDVCSSNGKCKGAGTRKGNGKCVCNPGYAGDTCFECSKGNYASYKDEKKIVCSNCHPSCLESCSGPGNTACDDCADGWLKSENDGCLDINECVNSSICPKNAFCVNSEGSYKCLVCDKACDGCSGDGPDMCIKCAEGFSLVDHVCEDASEFHRTAHINITRYLTYLGLCVATCIIFQRSMIVASIIGLAVGLYISVSEYMLSMQSSKPHQANPDISNLLDTLDLK